MNTKLWEIADSLAMVEDMVEAVGGELNDDLERLLDSANLDFAAKAENIGKWLKNLEGMEDMIDAEIKRLQARKKARENLRDRLREYVKLNMEKVGKTKIEYPAFTISVRANTPSVEIINEHKIPAKFLIIIPKQKVIDKKLVLSALKAGEVVKGAVLITNKTHLRLR